MNIKIIIQVCFKGLYQFFTNKHFRRFLQLLFRFGNVNQRYQEKKVTVNSLTLTIPDGLSFAWQYYEIFYKQYYRFTTSKDAPRIIKLQKIISNFSPDIEEQQRIANNSSPVYYNQ